MEFLESCALGEGFQNSGMCNQIVMKIIARFKKIRKHINNDHVIIMYSL